MSDKIVKYIKKPFDLLDVHTSEILKKSSAAMVVRVSGIALGVLISIFLGRTLGAKGLGVINLANQIIGILLMFSLLGFPTVILKEVSIAYSRKDWEYANSVVGTSMRVNGVTALVIISIVYLLLPVTIKHVFKEPLLKVPLIIFLAAMFFQVFSRIFASGANGYRKIWQSNLVNDALSLFLVAICLLVQYVADYKITIISVAWLYFAARVLVTIVMGLYWKKIRISSLHVNFIPKSLTKVALPLLFAQTTNIIANSVDTIMIGILINAADVGYYSVASRIATFSSIFLIVTNAALSPKVASMFANKELKEMEKMVQQITKGLIFIALGVFLIIAIFGKYALRIWGNEFQIAMAPLLILSFGQMVSVASGCVGLILTLCGQEKVWGVLTLLSAIINTILNLFFIKFWGISGAAIATAFTVIFMNISGIILVKKRVGILTIPFIK